MSVYQYDPLRNAVHEIRLVHLLPGNFGDDIKIRIVHAPLPVSSSTTTKVDNAQVDAVRASIAWPWTVEEIEGGNFMLFNVVTGQTQLLQDVHPSSTETLAYQPRYEALSYTWGNAGITSFCQVEDTQAKSGHLVKLGLRPSLASALHHLRYPVETRILWIDAICINQNDVEERNEQVKRMTNIYSLATRVIAWLGEGADNSRHAITTLQDVGRQLEVTKSGRVIAAPNAVESNLWRNDHAPSFDERTWQALSDFVERGWFYRLWCWQEINLGSSHAILQCGNDMISWSKFWLAVLCLHNKDKVPSMGFRERCRHIVFLKYNAQGHSMSNILDISRSKGCSDARDKIYGLLGLTSASFSSSVLVDYSQPPQNVYKQAFLAHSNATKWLELLKHCDLADRKIEGPSWVPDWSQTEFKAPILSEQLSSGMSRAWFAYAEPNVLEIIGRQYTTIKTVSKMASKSEEQTLLAVKEWYQYLPTQSTYINGESMEAAFALSLCINRTRERHPYNHFLSMSEWVVILRKILALTANSQDDPLYAARETANTIQKIRGRRFFTTETGHIGTAPAGAQVGDVICLILGTYAPLVLRQTPNEQFQVVGECYVHGLSDAVGILGPLPNQWNVIIKGDAFGRPTHRFVNPTTGRETLDDPRLGALPSCWERVTYARLPDDPAIFERYENSVTGEVVNYDPRLSPDALRARGVELQSFKLI